MELLKTILNLISQLFAIGLPPGVTDETGFRNWIKALGGVIAAITATTPTALDDLATQLLTLATNSDEAWSLFYSLLVRTEGQALAKGTPDEITADAVTASDPELAALADQTGIGPAEILAIIQLVSELITWFRKRKEA
jgi:hypothetical protein